MRVMVALLFLVSVCCTAMPGGADALPTAAEIRAKSEAAAGPVPDNYRQTIVGTGSLGETKSVSYHAGADVRYVYDRGTFHSESGTYHGETWRQNRNGLTIAEVPDPGKAAKDPLRTTVTRVTSPIDAYVITEMNVRKAGTRTFYDPTTFHEVRFEDVDASGTDITTYDTYATFGKRTLAQHWQTTSKEDGENEQYVRTEYVEGAATPADVAEAPTRRALVEFPPGPRSAVLPTQFYEHDVYVRVQIGSRVGDFALDTGASSIVIDPTFAKSAGLVLTDATNEMTAGRYTGYQTKIPEMHVGTLTLHDIAANAAPLNFGSDHYIKIVGLLGFDFLAQLGVTIDYEHAKVTVVPANNFVPSADPATYDFPIRIGDGVPMVTATIGNAVAERMFCDTGWDGQLAFMDYFTRRYPSAFKDQVGVAQSIGVGGAFESDVFRFHDITLGSLRLHDFDGARIPESSYLDDADGVIGNELLSMFSLGLDYTHGHIYLTPNTATKRAMRPEPG